MRRCAAQETRSATVTRRKGATLRDHGASISTPATRNRVKTPSFVCPGIFTSPRTWRTALKNKFVSGIEISRSSCSKIPGSCITSRCECVWRANGNSGEDDTPGAALCLSHYGDADCEGYLEFWRGGWFAVGSVAETSRYCERK